jgi:threonine/homoserine/homoserine lactone efflux protein
MTFESATIFVIALVIAWVKPGPGQAAIITRSLNDGFFAGFCVVCGIVVGCSIYFVIAALGVALIAEYANDVGVIFKLIGAIYLFYIGYKGLTQIEDGLWKEAKNTKSIKEIATNFMTGFLITMSNPITIFFFLGILPSIVPLAELTSMDILILLGLLIYFGLLVDTIIAGLASQVRETLSHKGWVKKINMTTSIGFIAIGAFLLFAAITDFEWVFEV